MATKGYPTKGIKSIVKVRSKKAPVKGAIFVEWDLLFKSVKAVAKKDEVIKELLNHIKATTSPGAATKVFTLEFQCFKCETNDRLYILRVYKQNVEAPVVKKTVKAAKAANIAAPAAAAADDLASNSVAADAPLRPPGPPNNPVPPTFSQELSSITNAVGLPEN